MKEWREEKVGDVFEVTDFVANGSFATLRENVTYYDEPNYAVLVRVADNSSGFKESKFVYIDKHSYDFLSKSSLNGGEIIMSNVGSVGKVFICPDLGMPMSLGPNSIVIKTPYNPFYYYYFQSDIFLKNLKNITSQATLAKFNKTGFKSLMVPVPSLSEQERIVKQLDDAFAKIDALKENAQKGLQAVKDLWQATLKEELKPKEGWKKSSLEESCISIKDGSHNPPKGVEYSDFLMLSSRNIQNGYLDTKDVRYLSQDDFEIENARTKAEKGQVLLTIVGTIGRTCVLTGTEGNITFQRSVSVITPKELINPYYLMYYFLSINEILNEKANGAAQKGIYLKQLSNLEIIIPSIREQEYLVKKLDCLSEKCKQMQFQYEQELTEYDALKQSILRKAFSGEL